MTVLRLPPRCYGVKAADGTTYRSNPGGSVYVEDPQHVRQILKDDGIAGDIIEAQFAPRNAKSVTCICGFVAYSWQSECPRCKHNLKETPIKENNQ